MADLKIAVEDTVEKLKTLMGNVEEHQSTADSVEASVAEVISQFDQAWTELEQRFRTLLEHIDTVRENLRTERSQVDETIAQLQAKLETTRTQVEEGLIITQASVVAISESAMNSQSSLEKSFEITQTAFEQLENHSIEMEENLGENLQQTENFLISELETDVASHEEELQAQMQELETCIVGTCIPAVTEQVSDFSDHAISLVERVGLKLTDVGDEVEESVVSFLDTFKFSHHQLLSGTLGSAQDVTEHLTGISEFVTDSVGDIQETVELLLDGVSTANIGVEAAVGTLEDVIDLLTLDL